MVPMIVRGGGIVQICSRRGCKGHILDVERSGFLTGRRTQVWKTESIEDFKRCRQLIVRGPRHPDSPSSSSPRAPAVRPAAPTT